MKRIGKQWLLALGLLLAACAKQTPEPPVPEQELRVSLSITRPDGFGTRATVKTGWENGDVVFVFFKGVAFPKYLEMKYDGGRWTPTPKNGLQVSDLTGADDQRMTALFLPYGNEAAVQSTGLFDAAYSGFFLQCELVGYTYTDALHGSLNLVSPTLSEGEILIHMDVSGHTAGHRHTLYQERMKPLTCTGVSPEGAVLFSEGTAGAAIPGFEFDEEGVRYLSFSGILEASAVSTATDYQFSIDDSDAGILHTRDAGTRTVTTSLAIGLGDLTAKWNANEYVDLGITRDGERILWATRNLGASDIADSGLFYAFGETAGYSADSGHDFSASPVFEVENDILKPSYDAAHVALKGLWRLPTKEEFSLLAAGTTNAFADGGMTFSGAGQTLFLPATGFLSATTHIQPGTYGCYWTSGMYNEVQAYFLGFGTSSVYPVDVTDTCYGQPVRPVFSIR